MPTWICSLFVFLLVFLPVVWVDAGEATETLRERFTTPPPEAWPRTWWHWTKGAVSEGGITKDLEWMERVGIVGFQLADVNFGDGQQVPQTVDFGSLEWIQAVRHAADEAERLGLEMAVFSSPGWSLTGGPWVKPEQAMKRLVWSEAHVSGPSRASLDLPQPPTNEGAFQDLGAGRSSQPGWYRDVKVIAFRSPHTEGIEPLTPSTIETHSGPTQEELFYDGKYSESITLLAPQEEGFAWIEQRFDEPVTVRSVTIAGRGGVPCGRVTASDDGESYRTLVSLPGSQLYRQARVRTFAIPETTARYFRLEITGAPLRPAETMNESAPEPAENYTLAEWRLDRGARVHRWEEKAGFGHLFEYETVSSPATAASGSIATAEVFDLSDRLQSDDHLDWEAPEGEWTILRLGMALTGARNRPATPAGSGYEVDKLSRRHTSAYYEGYARLLKEAAGEHYGVSLRYWLADSWEAGTQNWTDDMIADFVRLRGYDPTPYLPVLTGRIVGDSEVSDRFLWDFRRTLADLFAENHYGVLSERLAEDGLGLYSEASGVSLEVLEDTLLNKSKVDIPMGEFWVRDLHPRLMYLQDVRGAASTAHAYGKPIVAAEAFTGGGYESPFTLKRVSDYWFAQGINRLVYHTSAHQPLDTPPGNVMVGTHLHRNITWAELARPMNEYFARVCTMLQQGVPVVDVACLLDEGTPSTPPIWGEGDWPESPPGFKHDYLNADVLLNRLAVDSTGRLVLPDGMSYRLLVLPESRSMRPELLQKLHELVLGGATILGPRPFVSPSLMDQPSADARVVELAEDLWGDLNGTTRTVRYVGKGMVVWGRSVEDTLSRLSVEQDFEWSGPLGAEIAWTHRRTDDADIYYVSNLTDSPATIDTRFRTKHGRAELWRPDSGSMESVTSSVTDDGARLTLPLERNETLFVVFCDDSNTGASTSRATAASQRLNLSGPWEVSFPAGLGAPESVSLPTLHSFTDHDDAGIKHFSGTATYSIAFNAPSEWFTQDSRLRLELGEVRDLATVSLNGQSLGIRWKPPYQFDITDVTQHGDNRLEIRVTNQWTNRIAGDLATEQGEEVLPGSRLLPRFAPPRPQPSGLLGPVRILTVE